MRFPEISNNFVPLASACVGGGIRYFVAAVRRRCLGIGSHRFLTAGFRNPASCIPIRRNVSSPLIQGRSRMR
jgi:hypothetical protein